MDCGYDVEEEGKHYQHMGLYQGLNKAEVINELVLGDSILYVCELMMLL